MTLPTSLADVVRLARANLAATAVIVAVALAAVPIWVPIFIVIVVITRALGTLAPPASAPTRAPTTTASTIAPAIERPTTTTTTTTTGSSEPVALTGSAAMLAKMRKSSAVTGEKRIAAAKEASTSAREGEGDEKRSRTFILHGGEAASEIARDLASQAEKGHGVDVRVRDMEDFRDVEFDTKPCAVIFIVETVENAQPAEAAGSCVRFFNRKRKEGMNQEMLKDTMTFTVLGLGDTNLLLDRQTTTAKDCNQAAQTLDSTLAALGATRFHPRGEANDAIGLDEDVVPWSEKMFPKLAQVHKELEAKRDAKLCFLYGSQTGNASEICKNLAAEAGEKGYPVEVCSMNEVEPDEVLKPGAVITFVVSSTGDGDAPDNCDTFFTRLKRKSKKEKGEGGIGVQYAVLGLGDQNYSAFMAIPRQFSQIMENLGAKSFAKRGECDDTLGLYEQVDKWTGEYWGHLEVARAKSHKLRSGEMVEENETIVTAPKEEKKVTESSTKKVEGVPPLPICRSEVEWLPKTTEVDPSVVKPGPDSNGAYTVAAPYMATISASKLLTNPDSDRRVLHVEFDLGSSGITYKPGDSVGVIPQNNAELVRGIVSRLKLDSDAVFALNWKKEDTDKHATHPLPHIRTPCTVESAFTNYIDITGCPRKSLLRVLAEHCSNEGEKNALLHLSSRGGRTDYDKEIRSQSPTLLTLLEQFKSCSPPLAELLDALSPLAPRLYSITCAPEAAPTTPSVAFSVVKFEVSGSGERLGVATNWLDAKMDSDNKKVPVYIKPSLKFGLPEDSAAPLIMIGPGTGVAPFRGFLQARRARMQQGHVLSEAMLFFGCRKPDEDFLYREDWDGFTADGTLSRFVCAFSRETSEKVYVQHKLKEHAKDIARLISEGAYIMVCGDGAHMAKDVHAVLAGIVADAGVCGVADLKAAEALLMDFTKSGRYVRDIWS